MRWSLLILVAGCHKSPSEASARALPKPEPVAFAKLDAEAQCSATAARVRPCVNEILKAELGSLSDGQVVSAPALETSADDKDAAMMHHVQCLEPTYPKAVVECWTVEGCEAFATCIVKHEPEHGSGSARVR